MHNILIVNISKAVIHNLVCMIDNQDYLSSPRTVFVDN